MKVVFIDWSCFDRDDTKRAMEELGHQVTTFSHPDYNAQYSECLDDDFREVLRKTGADCVFSYNYFPLIALSCKNEDIPYISFLYDNPYAYIFSYTLAFPTNYVFLFDSSMVDFFQRGGLQNVYYMNLPGVPEKIEKLIQRPYEKDRYVSDISFVGSLYHEEHNFYDRIEWSKNPYADGYVKGLMDAQRLVNGYNFIEECLSPPILEQLQRLFPLEKEKYSIETDGFRFADYVINRKLTSVERMDLLQKLGERFGEKYRLKLFTIDRTISFKGIENMGVAVYETEMPYVFYHSRINLNISLRSIRSGIPMRCMDIMAARGFLLSNFQKDFLIDFCPDEDFVFYEDEADLMRKIEYYLSHEKERIEIAENGYRKVQEYFTIEKVLLRIFDQVFSDGSQQKKAGGNEYQDFCYGT